MSAPVQFKDNIPFDIETCRDLPADTLLLDSFERVVGTPDEQDYSELVLYLNSSDTARLVRYAGNSKGSRIIGERLVPLSAVQAVLDVIRQYQMDRWPGRDDLTGICGKLYVLRFPDGRGGYLRVTSEAMPPDGTDAFHAVRRAIMNLPAKPAE